MKSSRSKWNLPQVTRTIRVLLFLVILLTLPGNTFSNSLSKLTILQENNHPKVFFFRTSEIIGKNETIPYALWDNDYSQLMGIIGKVLNNELLYITERGSESFKKFKITHPEQIVLNHYNGNARDPRHEREIYFDGHWLYYNGARIIKDVPATTDQTEIHVDQPLLFKTNIGRYGNDNEEIGLCMLDATGKPDWHQAEQVKLISVDLEKSTITVQRGQYGTKPLSFPAGKAYAAAHMHTGPWDKKGHILWRYNHSVSSPRDKNGKRTIDVRVDEIKRQFSPEGRLYGFDGLEFDVLVHNPSKMKENRGADCDADGIADDCIVGGRQVYGIGVVEFMRMLRKELGDDKLILGDGHSERHNRAFSINNGIESEGWPDLKDDTISDWSGGMNRHYFWQQNAREPKFNYLVHKFLQIKKGWEPPFSTHRLVFAAAVFTDSAIALGNLLPETEGSTKYPVWDELVMGAEKKLGWLGKPMGPAVHLADQSPDLLAGAFTPVTPDTLKRIQFSAETSCGVTRGQLSCSGRKEGNISFVLKKVPITDDNLTIQLKAQGEPMAGYPTEVARLMEVELVNAGQQALITKELPKMGIGLRGKREQEGLPDASGAKMRHIEYNPGNGTKPAYFIHPPGKSGKGHTWFQRDVSVPDDGMLEFYTAMGEKSSTQGDGVLYRIQVAEISGEKTGSFQQIFEHQQNTNEWIRHTVSLKAYSRKTVALKFISDCGPKDNSTADHSYWGSIVLKSLDNYHIGEEGVEKYKYMSFVNHNPFVSRFFFPKVNRQYADIRVTIEGSEPVVIEGFTAHAVPDIVYREFENGLVVANPGLESFTCNLEKMVPGKKYRRLQATPKQDIKVNNGEPVGSEVTLGKKDALFLVRTK